MYMRPIQTPPRTRGFTLVEVMVAVIVISVGLLGIASMQALALASTNNARMRSLAAIQAASLASIMHVNRDYWAKTPPPTVGVAQTTITDGTGILNMSAPDCASAVCDAEHMAAYDFQAWVAALNSVLPNPTATILCPNGTPPLVCSIQIKWLETNAGLNKQALTTGSAILDPTYQLYVQP